MKTKILIVDDLRENILALSKLIEADDLEILSAESADGALDLLLDHEFALALVDVQMPTMSGFELARLIRGVERSKHLPIIFVTAQQIAETLIFEGYETGAVDVLFKPVDPHIVRSKVRVFVRLDQQNRLMQEQVETMSRLKEAAEAASIAKSRFLANMSHEIRTPLSAVLGFSDVLAQNNLNPEERKECLNSIRRNGHLLLRIIDDVLDLSRIEAEKLELETVLFQLEELLEDVRVTLEPKAQQKGLQLKFEMAQFESGLFSSDPLRLKQILLNTIGNAIKFTEEGSVRVKVQVEKDGSDYRTLRFTISDTGVGLNASEQERLFQPFVQADSSTRRKFGGTGLGLAISRQLARNLGGDLILKSSLPRRGSTFELTILSRFTAAEGAKLNELKSKSFVPSQELQPLEGLHGKKVLVVDDVVDNRSLMERYLTPAGLTVGLASGGSEALARISEDDWDAILMDIQMPMMDGYEVTKTLRERGFEKPIIALTAHAMQEELSKCFEVGCDATLTKPVARRDLLEKLASVIQGEAAH